MITTLIKTLTASGDSSLAFVDGAASVVLDDTYDEYMFVFSNIGPASEGVDFQFQVNSTNDAGGGYDTSLITSTAMNVYHAEGSEQTYHQGYDDGRDLAQSANNQVLFDGQSDDSDTACSGYLNLYSPSSTTYVKHFTSRVSGVMHHGDGNFCQEYIVAGYINDASYAIDEIQFKMSSGNFDGVIQLFGIA